MIFMSHFHSNMSLHVLEDALGFHVTLLPDAAERPSPRIQ
jgi:hypothetical protein